MTQKHLILVNFLVPLLELLVPRGYYATGFIMAVIVVPAVLLLFNVWLHLKGIETSWVKCCVFIFLGLSLAQLAGYIIWGITTRRLFRPDVETVAVNIMLAKYYAGFAIVLFLLMQAGKFIVRLFKS